MTFDVRPAALADLVAARDYYNGEREGLGDELVDEFDAVQQKIGAMPLRFPALPGTRFRRAPLRRFPYFVVFELSDELIRILAFVHERERPRSFTERR